MKNPNTQVQRFAADAIRWFGPHGKWAVSNLLELTSSPDFDTHEAAIHALNILGTNSRPLLPRLKEMLVNEQDEKRQKVIAHSIDYISLRSVRVGAGATLRTERRENPFSTKFRATIRAALRYTVGMITFRWALGLALSLLITSSNLRADKVDQYVSAQMKKYNAPGLSLAVVKNGKVIKSKGYGLANVELNARATPDTVYQWASVTKQFTAAAVLLLADDGKLKLDERINVCLTNTPPAWSNVTVRHLLNHTSGIKSYTGLPGFFKDIRKDFKQDELIGLVRELPLEFEPGERWSYNNSGYFLLGMIIERVSGRTYGDFLQERIFSPLEMTTARVNEQFLIITNRATGYAWVSNRVFTSEFVSPTQPYSAGALAGTVFDLAKWDAALYGDRLLSAANRESMWTLTRLNDGKTRDYGLGWELGNLRGHRFVAHGGGIHGFSTYILRLLEDKLTVIVLMNGPGNSAGVAQGVADRYVRGLLLTSVKPQRDPDPALTERLKECLRDLAATKDSSIITPEFREDYARARGRTESLSERLKEMKSFTLVAIDPAPAGRERLGVPVSRLVHYKLIGTKETRFYTFDLTADGKVAFYQSAEQ